MTVASLVLALEGALLGLAGVVLVYAAVVHRATLLYANAIGFAGCALVACAAAAVAAALTLSVDASPLPYALLFVGSVGHLLAGWRLSTSRETVENVFVGASQSESTNGGFDEVR